MTKALAVQEENKSPDSLIRLAIEKGADLDKLEKVLALQERYEANVARKAYHKAMADFKANAPKIDKDKKVAFSASGGGKTAYKHASLFNVVEKIRVVLSKYGLSAAWGTKQTGEEISVTCTITHELGHSESTVLAAKADVSGSKNAIQAIGSSVTYLERYTLLAITGLATYEQDDDGNAAVMEFINADQRQEIIDLIAEKEVNAQKFLEFLHVESLDKLPASKYQTALVALKNKKKAAK